MENHQEETSGLRGFWLHWPNGISLKAGPGPGCSAGSSGGGVVGMWRAKNPIRCAGGSDAEGGLLVTLT